LHCKKPDRVKYVGCGITEEWEIGREERNKEGRPVQRRVEHSRRAKSYFLKKKYKKSQDKEGLVIEQHKKTVNEQWHEIFFVCSTGNLISRLRFSSLDFMVGKNTNQQRPRHR
jgi:hypothetical protein